MQQDIATITIVVKDYDEAVEFFVQKLNFELVEDTSLEPDEPGKRWVVVKPPGSTGTCLLLAKAANPDQVSAIGNQSGGRVFLFLHTDDFWRDFHTMKAKGIVFCRPPKKEAYGTVAVFADLYGNKWDLIGPAEENSKGR